MNRQELKEALRDLAKEDPEFMKELIREAVTTGIFISSVSDGDYYNPETTYALSWENVEFSRAYQMKPTLVLLEGDMCHRYVDGKRTESARIVSDANSKRIKEDIEFFRENGLSLEEE